MASKLSIISGAAVRLGESPVISLSEDTKTAQAGNALYDTILDSSLSMTRWRFATGQIALSLLTEAPLDPRWRFAYQLPTNPAVVTIIKVFPRTDYERYENKLYCNTGNGLAIDYVYRPDADRFPPYFVELMEIRMASAMAMPVTGSRTLKQLMDGDLMGNNMVPGLLAQAMAADARERPADRIVHSPFTDMRR